MNISVAEHTSIGGKHENQDCIASNVSIGGNKLFIVCDGVGGSNAGKKASEIGVLATIDYCRQNHHRLSGSALIRRAIEYANSSIYSLSRKNRDYKGMATTISLLLINAQGEAILAHVGDSRIYRFSRKENTYITKDHSVVQNMVDSGEISKRKAEKSPLRNQITRALGTKEIVDVDVVQYKANPGDVFLLSSDGFHDELSLKTLRKKLLKSKNIQRTLKGLAKKANSNGAKNKNGRHDNLSAIAISIDGDHTKIKLYKIFLASIIGILLGAVVLMTLNNFWPQQDDLTEYNLNDRTKSNLVDIIHSICEAYTTKPISEARPISESYKEVSEFIAIRNLLCSNPLNWDVPNDDNRVLINEKYKDHDCKCDPRDECLKKDPKDIEAKLKIIQGEISGKLNLNNHSPN